jgi:hypothetical protein
MTPYQADSPDLLVAFCNHAISRYKDHWPPEEGKLAHEFFAFLSLKPLITSENLKLFSQSLGVEFSLKPLQEGLYGVNGAYGSRREIVVSNSQGCFWGMEHTFLHELRELLEYIFRDLGSPTCGENKLEERAEGFATEVRMQLVSQMTMELLGDVQKVQTNWKRWLGYAVVSLFGLVLLTSCALHPQMEEAFRKSKKNRDVALRT